MMSVRPANTGPRAAASPLGKNQALTVASMFFGVSREKLWWIDE